MPLPHGCASRVAKARKLTATQFYKVNGQYLKDLKTLRDERMALEMAQIEKEIAERKAAMDAAEIKASDLVKTP